MRITSVECHVLLVPDVKEDAASSAQDDFIVEVHTDEGVTGIGESDLNPWIARACLEAPSTHNMGLSLREMLVGEDPLDPPKVWEKLYVGSAMNGRRGAVINTMGAIDIALWDICGKAAGKPIYELLGGAARDSIVPYASCSRTRAGLTRIALPSSTGRRGRERDMGFAPPSSSSRSMDRTRTPACMI